MPDWLANDLALTPLVGVLYTVMFTALAYLRREGLSVQFIGESLVLTALLTVPAAFTGASLYPLLALAVLYVATMRCRLILELANMLARRGPSPIVQRLYTLAGAWFPDALTRTLVQINHGTARLLHGEPAQAQSLLEAALAGAGPLPPKYEAAARYNLGVAYRRQDQENRARQEFQRILSLMPENTTFHARAQRALEWEPPARS